MTGRHSLRRLQRGQSLTEFVAVALALVPLFLIVPLIGKYQDIGHMTQLASRYAAFDATIGNDATGGFKPEAQLANEVRRRFFSNSDAPIKTGDTAGDFTTHRNLLWVDTTRHPLINDFGRDVTVTYGPGEGASHGDGFIATSAATSPFLGEVRSALGLADRGIYRTNVAVTVASIPNLPPFDALDLTLIRQTSVALDPWSARSADQVEQRVNHEKIFPTSALADISSMVDAVVTGIDWPGGVTAPKLGRLDFWRDMVPQDRLRNAP